MLTDTCIVYLQKEGHKVHFILPEFVFAVLI